MKIKIERNNIVALVFLFIIYGMLIGMFVNHGGNPISHFITRYRTEVLQGTPIFERVEKATQIAESVVSDKAFLAPMYIEEYGFIQKLALKKVLADAGYGEIYKTKYNQITFKIDKKDDEVEAAFLKVQTLKKELDASDIPFLYVQAPFKLSGAKNDLPKTRNDFSDYNVDKFLNLLKENNIDYIDLRKCLRENGKTPKELFYDTDHHWKIETAFDATNLIEKKLNEDYGFSIDEKYSNIDNFKQKITKKCFLGSMGRRTGMIYAGLDDFNLITPDFDTDYTLTQIENGNETVYNGSFEKAILSSEYVSDKKFDPYLNRYAVYHGDNEQLVFKNNLVNKGKVMIIKDSFGIPVYSFLSLGVNEVRALDLRLFKFSVSEYAMKHKPDIVLLMYNGDAFSDVMYNFEGEL
ncbi:MAG: alginate O-acetyltransferase AlgX-related protein [Eubacteriales bacterium]